MVLDELLEQAKAHREGGNTPLQGLQERIRGGESTGDPCHDFAITQVGELEPGKWTERFRGVYDQLAASKGKLVVVLHEVGHDGSDGLRLGSSNLTEAAFIGFLKENGELSFDHEGCEIVLPTDGYVQINGFETGLGKGRFDTSDAEAFSRSYIKVEGMVERDGPIRVHGVYLKYLDSNIITHDHIGGFMGTGPAKLSGEALTILTGDSAVLYFVNKDRRDAIMRTEWLARVRAVKSGEALEDQRLEPNHFDLTYLTICDMLGRDDAPLYSMFKAEEDKRYNEEFEEINKVLGRYPLIAERGTIVRNLEAAVRRGMHTQPSIIELHPGVNIDFPVYLKALCKRYEVDIPESKFYFT